MCPSKPRSGLLILLLLFLGSACTVTVSAAGGLGLPAHVESHSGPAATKKDAPRALLQAVQQKRAAQEEVDSRTTTVGTARHIHRKLAEAHEHVQHIGLSAVGGQKTLLFGGGLLILAFVVFCGAVVSCFAPPVNSEEAGSKTDYRQGVQLQHAKPTHSTHSSSSSKPSLAGSSHHSRSTGAGQVQRPASVLVTGESPRTPHSGSSDSTPKFKPFASGSPGRAHRAPEPPAHSSKPAEKRQLAKPPLPTPMDAQEPGQPRQAPLPSVNSGPSKMSVKAEHAREPLQSPWEGRPAASLERIPENPDHPDTTVSTRSSSGGLPMKHPQPSDSAESMGSNMSRGVSGDIAFPHQLGRRHSLMIKGANNPTFSPEEEEQAAGALVQASRTLSQKAVPARSSNNGLGERILLKDVKLKTKGGKPVVLGEGGFGRVFLGSLHKEEVAVKTVLEGTRKEQARFLREIKMLEQLSTAHITRYMGYSVCPEGLVLIMEYCPGGNLTQALAKSTDDQPSEFQYYNKGKQAMLSIALALQHLHAKKIAHLDIKSPNILIGRNSEAKVADCGLSRLVKGDSTAISKPGTFAWAAPEQIQGTAGTQADIWAFGTVLWEVCTCEKPPNMRQLRAIDVPEEAPQEVVDLISKCHNPNPLLRIKANALHAELQACPWEQVE